ncbi:MAG: MotA/TolQ/ExbB proton channel family protein [Hyphomicrobiaceae bacterium]
MAASSEFSLYNLLINADPVVQAVMAGLALCSVVCWALILEKVIRMASLKRQTRELESVAARGHFSGEEQSRLSKAVYLAADAETTEGAVVGEDQNDRRARLERAMRRAMKREFQRAESGLPFLATVGSAAPFIGLFGTVWGIMNSFTSIAQSKDTSLAVVAPGIAEALFATAIGLAAAIPAVIAYNQFVVGLGRRAEGAGDAIRILAKKSARRAQDAATSTTQGAA